MIVCECVMCENESGVIQTVPHKRYFASYLFKKNGRLGRLTVLRSLLSELRNFLRQSDAEKRVRAVVGLD